MVTSHILTMFLQSQNTLRVNHVTKWLQSGLQCVAQTGQANVSEAPWKLSFSLQPHTLLETDFPSTTKCEHS